MKLALIPKRLTWPAGICAGLLACSLMARAAEPWTLGRALDYARAHNPDARIAQQRIAIAALRKALAFPQLDPQLATR